MQRYICSHCGAEVFFQNDLCLSCGKRLGFDPVSLSMRSLEEAENGIFTALPSAPLEQFRLCSNGLSHAVCNWMIPAGEDEMFCQACRLNEIIPDLALPGNLERWGKIEVAKRRCVYSLLRFKLPMDGLDGQPGPLRFRFLSDAAGDSPVFTGHSSGCITLNITEADDHERERVRAQMHEPYRTLVGHFRHELGHFYWDRLVRPSSFLEPFRRVFGDERKDYVTAMQAYYRQGPAQDTQVLHVTPYASAHPWEDWAETWAHYFHIIHTTRIAESYGLSIPVGAAGKHQDELGQICDRWIQLSCAFNAVNRAMGLNDLYPFVLSEKVVDKLRFVHQVVLSCSTDLTVVQSRT